MRYTFANFILDSNSYELTQQGERLVVEPQVIEIINLLVSNHNRLVSRDEIFQTIWRDRIVSESTLNSLIKMARKILGDSGKKQKLIQTVRGKGFRYIGKVDALTNTVEAASITLGKQRPGIAVLPFENLSGDSKQDYIAEGLSSEIINALAIIPDLLVISKYASFAYRNSAVRIAQIGQELGVDYLVEGSVSLSADRIRISARLSVIETAGHLWVENYDRNVDDLFTIQDNIAREISIALQVQLGFDASLVNFQCGASNHEAWRLCLKGIEKYNRISRVDNAAARELLERAITIDPNYDGALSALGWSCYSAVRHDLIADHSNMMRRLKEVIKLLFERNSNHGEAWFLLSGLRLLEFDCDAAIEAGLRAIELKPNDANTHAYLAQIYCCKGHLDNALYSINYAIRLSPQYATWMLFPLIDIHCQMARYAESLEYAKLATVRAPDSLQFHVRSAVLNNVEGRAEQAENEISRLLELDYQFTIEKFQNSQKHINPDYLNWMGEQLKLLGIPSS